MDRNVRYRWLSSRLPRPTERRLVIVGGARQTGKTTLARTTYPDLRYLNLDDLELRTALAAVPTIAWPEQVGPALLDEAQKQPVVFEKVKHAYDAGDVDFTVLMGSSRILLMERVRETLAGRAFVYDLWPLMVSEILHPEDGSPAPPLLDALLARGVDAQAVLATAPGVLLPADDHPRRQALHHLLHWGGMPELLRLTDTQRRDWLRSYRQTFLERDLADLVRLADLEPFSNLQRLCMLRSGALLSFAELGRDAHVSAVTARRYLEYLRLSYQVLLLRPYARNLTSAVVKSPKLYWIDNGLRRQGTRSWGDVTGADFETVVVTEIHKWVSTMSRDAELSFYRTRSGMEVDLLVETSDGVIGIEVKLRDRAKHADGRSLRPLAHALGQRWRCGLVVHAGTSIEPLDDAHRIWGVPAHRLLT